ncbi:MAG: hypothetical protein A2284_14595 [Deltaproteobacteria bacterium RIFOXYA12_FULL_61_11]|nr:MAG: hypothetical protein A2284_14595 [Deltaproteobacteria bacterium RIFOXYA12_FULL_61_11]
MAKPEDKTILVVDDEADAREYMAAMLEDAGFKVVLAANGEEALEHVRAAAPDFISLDLVMPLKSGIRFLHELRRNKQWAKIPFVIVTAHAGDDEGRDDLANILDGKTFSGPGFYLEKPVKAEVYVRYVCEQVGLAYDTLAPALPSSGLERARQELQDLLEHADESSVQEALRVLRGGRR